MSASMVLKFFESVHGCFEDFLEAESLVGAQTNTKNKATSAQTQNMNTNLISVKLVQK